MKNQTYTLTEEIDVYSTNQKIFNQLKRLTAEPVSLKYESTRKTNFLFKHTNDKGFKEKASISLKLHSKLFRIPMTHHDGYFYQ